MSYKAFDAYASEYDAWYDSEPGATIFAMEAECLQPLLHSYRRPYLEVGVGSGRFAQALGIKYGADPSVALLQRAKSRDILVIRAVGETLPFPDSTFGAVLVALTLCFVAEPLKVLKEAARVVKPDGALVLGLILQGSPWADFYVSKGAEGHPLYRRARFFAKEELEHLLHLANFTVGRYRSVLFQPPGQRHYRSELPVKGYHHSAGFVALNCHKLAS